MVKSKTTIKLLFYLILSLCSVNLFASTTVNNSSLQITDYHKFTFKGTIVDNAGEPMVGVSVIIKDTKLGCQSNIDGHFEFSGKYNKDNAVVVFSFTGFKTITLNVKNGADLKVVMEEDHELLKGVVLTGIFKRKTEGFTGSSNTIKKDDIIKVTSGNVLKAIELLDPGFRMGSNNVVGSNPSGVPDFNVRGQSSMGDYSTEDKVVLRGDIDTRPNQPLFVLDGIIGVSPTKVMDLDPEQIQSITLLKDAAAMVLYGSRASNGVVVIETTPPKEGKLRITYNGNYKLMMPDLRDYNLTNSWEKLQIEKMAGIYDEVYLPDPTLQNYENLKRKELELLRGVNTYWLNEPVHTVFDQRHGISIEGGDNSLRYKLYAGINNAPGVMKNTGVYGKNASMDIRYRQGKFLLSNVLFIDHTRADRTSPYGSFRQYTLLNPYYRKTDANGGIPRYLEKEQIIDNLPIGVNMPNPVWDTQLNVFDKNTAFDVRNALKIEYSPIDEFRLSVDATIFKSFSQNDAFKSGNHSSFAKTYDIKDKGMYLWSKTDRSGIDIGTTLSYNNLFNFKHFISSFLYFNIKEDITHSVVLPRTGFPNEAMDEVYLGAVSKEVSGDELKSRSLGVLGTVSYTYSSRYAVDANVRLDASSEFGRNNRWAPFWSVGGRWNVYKEKFMQKNNLFGELVLRASYGITGTQGFTPYQSMRMYTYKEMMRIYDSSDVVGVKLIGLGNNNLKWQTTDSYNIGLDFATSNGIFSGRVEYYYRYTKNLILDFSLPPSVGFNTVPENFGNISNKGFEITTRFMPLNIPSKRLNWSFTVTGSQNKNRIEQISNAMKVRNEAMLKKTEDGKYAIPRPLPRYEEGYSQSMIWAVRSIGIDPQTGREVFLTRDGKRTDIWNPVDMVPVGDSEPKLTGVLSSNFNYKGLSLSVAARYSLGGKMFNRTLVDKIENADPRQNMDKRAYTDRWKQKGDIAKYKAISKIGSENQTNASTRFLMNNNYLICNVINAQYRIEQHTSPWLKKMGLTSASVGLYLEDIFRLTSIKVERGLDYPLSRSVSLSLNLTF